MISGCLFLLLLFLAIETVLLRAWAAVPAGRGVRGHGRRRVRQPRFAPPAAAQGGGAQEVRLQEALPQLQEPGVPARSDQGAAITRIIGRP